MSLTHQFNLDSAQLDEIQLDPALIVEGEPKLSLTILSRSADRTTVVGLFRSTPGTYRFTPSGDEWTLVRKGRLKITADDGSSADCRPGDVYVLRNGGAYVFEVVEDLEDYFVTSNAQGLPL